MVVSTVRCRHCGHESDNLNEHLDHLQEEHPEQYDY